MNNRKVKILNTTVINDNNISNKSKKLNKKTFIFSVLILLLLISIMIIPRDSYKSIIRKILAYAGIYTEEIKSVEIESNDYNNPGSFKITKSAKWKSQNKVQITFDVDSIIKTGDNYKDIILVLDNSGSMDGEKLTKAISDSKDLVNTLLSDSHNRVGLITFNSTSQVLSTLTNNKEIILGLLDNITSSGNTNYNVALQKINTVMTDYVKNNDTDVVALFLTDGYPNEGTPSEVAEYTVLKDKYPYLTINGVQYEMGKDIIDEITAISDNQFVANKTTLNNVLIEAGLNPEVYEKFIIEDYINTDYFNITSTDDIKTSQGTATIEEESGEKKVVWNLGDNSYVTGSSKTMTIDLTLSDAIPSNKTFYPTNTKEVITYKLGAGEEQTITRTDTPVLTNKYSVIYDNNVPDGCVIENNINGDESLVYSTVSIITNELSCPGYLFRGWKIDEDDDSDITHINEDLFIMPGHNVTVRAEWSNQSITKSVDGTVNTTASLYKVLKDEAESNGLAREYTGEHHDSFTEEPSQKIYHWYADNNADGTAIQDKNNVIFAGHCWQMMRTTDTGGVKMIYNGEAVDNQCLSTRGTHVGYASRTSQYLASNYWYGTDYTYDSVAKTFKVSGTIEQTRWNATTGPGLVGKYTCRLTSEDGSCSTLYLVEEFLDSSSAYVIPLNSNSNYSQFGTLQFNVRSNSPSYVGYMYGDVYAYRTAYGTISQSFTTTQTMLQSTSLGTSYWYADSIDYGTLTVNRYSLVNPYQVSGTSDYPNLVGKYTFRSSSQTNTATNVYYIAAVNNSTMYYIQLQSGNLLSAYEPIVFGDSIRDNGDGTYTINNPTNVTLSDWYTNYANYKEKYTCNDRSTTCASPRYTTATTSTSYDYINAGEKIMIGKTRSGLTLTDTILVRKDELVINSSNYSDYKYTCNTDSASCTEATLRMISGYNTKGYEYAPNHYYGSSVTWDGTNYTLQDPIEIENYNNINNISTHHYMCVEYGTKSCAEVAYVYDYIVTSKMYYIALKDGVTTVGKALEDMLTKNTTNSTIKSGVDAWYKHYLLEDYDDYIEDTIFCNDRSIRSLGGWNPDGGMTNALLLFKEYNVTSDLSCTNTTDKFSVSNNSARLTYKVGLMSSPEMNILNNSKARKTGQYYWLASPFYFVSDYAYGRIVDTSGGMSTGYVHNVRGVCPAISLRPNIEYYTGDGSMEHPYIVDTSDE